MTALTRVLKAASLTFAALYPSCAVTAQPHTPGTAALNRVAVNGENPSDGAALLPASGQGILLLYNGAVLAGGISRAGDLYLVAMPGGQVRVKAADVELICRNLDHAYRVKRERIEGPNARGHLQLAEWCLNKKMVGYAARELADCLAIDPTYPGVTQFEQRLAFYLKQPQSVQAPGPENKGAAAPPDFDQVVKQLPAGSVERFTTQVQPLLVNLCSRCHNERGEGRFRVVRTAGVRTRRSTLRNLRAVLQVVDQAKPAESALVRVPLAPHGGVPNAFFSGTGDPHYQRLLGWIKRLTPDAAVTANTPGSAGGHDNSSPKVRSQQKPGAKPSAIDELPSSRGDPTPRTDPFDPEVFNRRFLDGGKKPTKPAANNPKSGPDVEEDGADDRDPSDS